MSFEAPHHTIAIHISEEIWTMLMAFLNILFFTQSLQEDCNFHLIQSHRYQKETVPAQSQQLR
jgi:hypothetical protein